MRDAAVQSVTDAAGIKVGAAVSGLGAVLAWEAPVAILGVPVAVLLAALTGALLGIIYGAPLASRREATQAVLVNTFLAGVVAVIVPHIPLFGWAARAPAGAIALILAFAARWAVPAAVEQLPAFIKQVMARLSAQGGGK